ncbi:MAG: sigma-54-dependent transcriptional regulator [Bacteroidota bacterium]|jgi:DNA-binding NtrC family response regulator|nr:sigma-54-dependent Fis family transcriptional regulator [Ignavibacteria bacterium]HEX2962687.1 sigma-54 dependent transcriptional regulator [Ignavibacteriales bacterium]MCU7499735.1 sigma-54-dependent Fis family transcriptional regulator [Ignavibacteria bacterium]MCU7513381.1 sigma-54-dependent Fis family transcriptional regulator [Ignavibacteria bacterium]MCU7519870.1 sigma-54-dependent Fis family transcriptional regulator [Ignavibacteria bacterium]
MKNKTRILIVDDEKIVRESLLHWFEEEGYEVDTAEDAEAALRTIDKGKYELMLVDMKMPGMSGLELLDKVKEIDKDTIFILITAFASVPTAIKALKNGAYDYITKPIDPDELAHIVEKAIHQRALRQENEQLKDNIDEIIKPDNLIGESRQMIKIFDLINTVAQTDTTVMIRGESGTGKELVAKAIHINSKRKYFPIVTVNCGALAETLLESELFGHEKGAFTGAHYKRKGKFEMADGGTIFLDEIGTVSPKMQIELLRVIETKQFTRVGGNENIKSDFRVIAATNEPLENLLKEGKFREDLYYRLNVFTIFLPPLRERRDDIPVLAYYFMNKFNGAMNKNIKNISNEAMDFLVNYSWPGNVRELENAIERALVVGRGDSIKIEDLPFHVTPNNRIDDDGDKSLESMEKRHIMNVLEMNNWNISKSAEALQIDRVTLYNKINKYGFRKS